jgi:hypothetical protein
VAVAPLHNPRWLVLLDLALPQRHLRPPQVFLTN